jgi:hypothetical protein
MSLTACRGVITDVLKPATKQKLSSRQKLKNNICEHCGSISRHKCNFVDSDRPRLPSLKSVLKEGNSDPFETSLVVVNPTVGRLLEFNKKCILPSIHGREVDNESYSNSYWKDSIASLQDECQGCGYLARFAAILACDFPSKDGRHGNGLQASSIRIAPSENC